MLTSAFFLTYHNPVLAILFDSCVTTAKVGDWSPISDVEGSKSVGETVDTKDGLSDFSFSLKNLSALESHVTDGPNPPLRRLNAFWNEPRHLSEFVRNAFTSRADRIHVACIVFCGRNVCDHAGALHNDGG